MFRIQIKLRYSLLLVACIATFAAGSNKEGRTLLVMGDSLAAGQLLNYEYFSNEGWANVLYEHLKSNYGFDTLVNTACTSEGTSNFINANPANSTECRSSEDQELPSLCYSGLCQSDFDPAFPGESQLDAVLTYIESHPGEVGLMAISLGINDIAGCPDSPNAVACATVNLLRVQENLSRTILPRLMEAAPGVPIIGTQYYNPFVSLYLPGGDSNLAFLSELLVPDFNTLLAELFEEFGAFSADTFANINGGDTTGNPRQDVTNVCMFTEMCIVGDESDTYMLRDNLDITDHQHPNELGYQQMGMAYIDVVENNDLLQVPTGPPTTENEEQNDTPSDNSGADDPDSKTNEESSSSSVSTSVMAWFTLGMALFELV